MAAEEEKKAILPSQWGMSVQNQIDTSIRWAVTQMETLVVKIESLSVENAKLKAQIAESTVTPPSEGSAE